MTYKLRIINFDEENRGELVYIDNEHNGQTPTISSDEKLIIKSDDLSNVYLVILDSNCVEYQFKMENRGNKIFCLKDLATLEPKISLQIKVSIFFESKGKGTRSLTLEFLDR